MVGHGGCLRVDFVAEDTGLVNADPRIGAISEFGARGEERVVADGLVDAELRAGNMGGEKFGAGVGGDGGVHGAGDDLRGDGDFGEGVWRESWAEGGCHSEDGADARVAMRLGVFAKRGLDGRVSIGESCDFGQKAWILDRIGTHTVGFR